ncbi:MAG: tetratricopeptide repeat protein [Candidatus Levybacteria bacterium]|nr:tetratricopeptide repeat protein [Candidatus Levybacteria bacterium]
MKRSLRKRETTQNRTQKHAEKHKVQFPSFSRFITDIKRGLLAVKLWLRQETLKALFSLVSFLIIVLMGFVGVKLQSMVVQKQELEKNRAAILTEIQYWQNVVIRYSNYRDAYFKIAILEYQLGNDKEAKEYLAKTLVLDPNFEQGRSFEKLLQ